MRPVDKNVIKQDISNKNCAFMSSKFEKKLTYWESRFSSMRHFVWMVFIDVLRKLKTEFRPSALNWAFADVFLTKLYQHSLIGKVCENIAMRMGQLFQTIRILHQCNHQKKLPSVVIKCVFGLPVIKHLTWGFIRVRLFTKA